jgi:NAD(P)-dependent dehydrogenase (short-subunit alcohol dehydrogenase family)
MAALTTELEGKVALVTGAASGIGAATVRRLSAAGAHVVATDLNGAGVARVAEAAGAVGLAHDVVDPAAWEAAVRTAVDRFGRLDILVSNAGIAGLGSIVDLSLDDFRRVARVHVEGGFLGIQLAVAQMRRQADGAPATGSIIAVSSIAATKPFAQMAAYGAAKAALTNMVRAIGVELGRKGDLIRCNVVHPGGTRTAITESAYGAAYFDDPANFAQIPLKTYARPEDIAEAIAFLASDEARFLTSTVLTVDGGWTAL